MTTSTERRTWSILRQRLHADVASLPIVWGLFVAGIAVLVAGVALLRGGDIVTSGWEQAAQFSRWYAGAMGVYLTAVNLPLYLTHGYTRREFAAQIPAFVALFAAAYALLMTVGYGLETLVYGVAGWQQALSGSHLFETPTQYPLVFTEFLLLGAAWTVAGAVLGAAFYRDAGLGLVLLPVGLIIVGVVEAAAGPRYFGPLPFGADPGGLPLLGTLLDTGSPGVAGIVTATVAVVGLALVWSLVRDLPIRSKAA